MLAILLFGIASYRVLPVSDLPNVDYPTINVYANLPGANPDTMAAAVALPLEKQFSNIAGLDSMVSSNRVGATSIVLQFNLDRNLDGAAQDVQAAISQAARQLPPSMPAPPAYYRQNPADYPVLFIALTSDTLPLSAVDEYAETFIAPSVSTVNGVAVVQIYGQFKYAPHIQLDPQALAIRRIGIDDVENALTNGNVNLPTGTIWGPQRAPTVQTQGQLYNAADYSKLIVAYRNGSPVRLSDLGRVIDSVQNDKNVNFFYDADLPHGISAIPMVIFKQPGTNAVQVVDGIKAMLPRLEATLPPSVKMRVLFDRSITIRNSVDDVKFTLELALFLVIMVIFLFLRNLSATTIPSLALPFSLVGTFAVMYLCGYSIDNLSLMALTLSVGFVVDDAIVMLENIVRHMEHGEGVREASLRGSREIGFTILSMTLSLGAVFLPVFFMSGILGRLLHEFAVVIISAILVSGFVSLSLTPMLCSRFLRPHLGEKHGRMYNAFERFFARTLRGYEVSLHWAMRHRLIVMGAGALLLFATAWQFYVIPKGFLPEEDQSEVSGSVEANQGISFDAMKAHMEAVNKVVWADPNTMQFFSSVSASGGFGGGGLNNGRFFDHLKDRPDRPWTKNPTWDGWEAKYGKNAVMHPILAAIRPLFEHHMTISDIILEMQPKLNAIPGMKVILQNPPAIQIGGYSTKSQYQFTLVSPDTSQLYKYAKIMEDKMKTLSGLTDVTTDLQIKNPQININIDRDKAQSLGVTPEQIENALYTAYGQRQISTIYAPNNEYWVIMELQDKYQRDPDMLSYLYVTSSSGKLVPLSAVSSVTTGLGPLTVNHTKQLPSVTVSFDLAPGVSLGQAVDEVQSLAKDILPITVTTSFQGTAQAFQQSLTGLGLLLAMAILVIYIVLGILYESFIHPLTILSGLPAAAFGALLTLMAFHMQLDLFGFVGIIMLIGIVKKNAIMMVDFALELQRSGDYSAAEAAVQGCLIRFRPIMMTTMAAIMGTAPIAFGWGAGADSRRPLGMSVVGGLVFAQVVTLYLTPVFYTYMDSFQSWLGRSGRKRLREAQEQLRLHEEPMLAPHAKRIAEN